jgi:hypothetical protein
VVQKKNGEVFEGFEGTAQLTFTPSIVRGTFNFQARLESTVIKVQNVSFVNVQVSPMEQLVCRAGRPFTATGFADYYYNSKGDMLYAVGALKGWPNFRLYYYDNKVVQLSKTFQGINSRGWIAYGSNGLISKIDFDRGEVFSFSYNTAGQLIKVNDYCIQYTGANVTRVGCDPNGSTYTYSNFDDRTSPGKALLESLKNQPALVFLLSGEDGQLLSANNPRLRVASTPGSADIIDQFAYTQYNSVGLPTAYSSIRGTALSNATWTYAGCN